ncbi:MAG: DNA-processing protein DprA [Propionibacteriaceae bacterium]|nr:DNA-processing protein DprA [Propionibacteriaceae bacterium]
MEDERKARMGLAAAHDAGDVGLAKLIGEQGAVDVWEYLRAGQGKTAIARRAAQIDVDSLMHRTDQIGARFVIPSDEQWPTYLNELEWSEPVGGVGGVPLGLWVSGPADLSQLTAVAMVGSRASTAYGEHVAADWAVGIAEHGYCVLSGGAYGIDSCAHRGALACGGATVAVMAGGLAQLYPSGNSVLLEKIRDSGAVVSEHPPDRPPSRARFLVRNRLIAALAKATVIVEGALRSGAQNTVSWALSLQRPVLAAPGPVTSAMSVTPHRLVRSGQATLVTSVEDILTSVEPLKSATPDYPRDEPTALDGLTPDLAQVCECLPARRSVSVDELCALTGESAWSLMASLGRLKQLGFVAEVTPGMWRVSTRPSQATGSAQDALISPLS